MKFALKAQIHKLQSSHLSFASHYKLIFFVTLIKINHLIMYIFVYIKQSERFYNLQINNQFQNFFIFLFEFNLEKEFFISILVSFLSIKKKFGRVIPLGNNSHRKFKLKAK